MSCRSLSSPPNYRFSAYNCSAAIVRHNSGDASSNITPCNDNGITDSSWVCSFGSWLCIFGRQPGNSGFFFCISIPMSSPHKSYALPSGTVSAFSPPDRVVVPRTVRSFASDACSLESSRIDRRLRGTGG